MVEFKLKKRTTNVQIKSLENYPLEYEELPAEERKAPGLLNQ